MRAQPLTLCVDPVAAALFWRSFLVVKAQLRADRAAADVHASEPPHCC